MTTNYTLRHVDLTQPRTELHDLLQLTGCELSINALPAGAAVPFVHSHRQNDELYVVLEGEGGALHRRQGRAAARRRLLQHSPLRAAGPARRGFSPAALHLRADAPGQPRAVHR